MSDFRCSMRAVLPPAWATRLALGISYGSWMLLVTLKWFADATKPSDFSLSQMLLEAEAIQKTFAIVPCFVAVAYGMWRALGRNPIVRPGYRNWLSQTPWRWPQPLPLGPTTPVWQDLVTLAFLTLPAIGQPRLPIVAPALCAVISYSVIVLFTTTGGDAGVDFLTGLWAFAIGAYFRETPAAVAIAVVVLLISAWRGIDIAIRGLHAEDSSSGWSKPAMIRRHGPLGWPYEALTPHSLEKNPRVILIAAAVSIGMILAAFRPGPADDATELHVQLLVPFGAIFIAMFRASMFASLAVPNWNVLKRLRYGRLLNVRPDALAVSSIAIVVVGFALPSLLLQLPTTGMNQLAVAAAILFALAFCLPPSRERWRLTSKARIQRRATPSATQKRQRRSPIAH